MATRKKQATPPNNSAESSLNRYARERLAALREKSKGNLGELPLFDFLVQASPHLRKPEHLCAVVPYMEAIRESPQAFALSAPPRHGKPLAGDTLVTMADGTRKAIRDVVVGDSVIGGHGKPTKVLHKFEQGLLPVFKITTYLGREIVAEGSHSFLTESGWKRVDELRSYNKSNWQRPRGNRLVPLASYEITETYLNPEEARFLGYMVGDGSCKSYSHTSKEGWNLTTQACGFTCAEPEVLERFIECVVSLGGDVTKIKSSSYAYGAPGMRECLRRHGMAGKCSFTKVVPPAIFSAQKEAVVGFLAGYMETDGRRGEHDQTSFSSVSKELLSGVQHLLARLGIRSALRVKNGKYKGQPHKSWRLSVHDEARFFDIVPVVGPRGGKISRSRRFEDIGDTVVSVEPAGETECFCIMVEESASFLAEGVVTHNSVLVNHLVAREMIHKPGIRVAYGCYNLDLAGFNSLEVKDILTSNNIELDRNQNSKEEWRTENGSVFKCVAPGSGFTGRGADLIIIDDPYKGRTEAESGRIRDATWNWFTAVAITRRSPHASVIVTHTRWTVDDLIGKVTKEHSWPYINLQAVNADGEALWPDEWPAAKLASTKSIIGPYEWASLYMGEPRPRGGSVFGDPQMYGGDILTDDGEKSVKNPLQLPEKFERIVIGIDCAYTKKTHSDYSVAVVLGVDKQGIHYILEVVRKQCEAPEFEQVLRSLRLKYGSPPIYWYTGGTEKAVADFFINRGLPVKAITARDDKFVRAQAVAAAWNAGRVLMPAQTTSWSGPFLSEVLLFTGLDDPHDDQVDALAAAFIPSAGKKVFRGVLDKRLISF